MKLLVLGSEGFIGRHVNAAYRERADVVTSDVLASESGNHVVLSPTEPDLANLLDAVRPDVCVNCAGAANVGWSFEHPDMDHALNVAFVQRLLESVRTRSPATRIITLSSAAVYGCPASLPITEDSVPAPISPYGWHKLASENLCREYAECFGVGTVSLRLFSVYGPGLRKQLYWDLFQKSRSADSIVMAGTGEETRDYVHVGDVVRAIDAVIAAGNFRGEAVNVASGEQVSVRRAATTLFKHLGWKGEVSFNGEIRSGDPPHWRADIQQLARLGFERSIDYDDGLRELATWLTSLQ